MNIASRRFLAFGIAAGVLGKSRAKQDVHIPCRTFDRNGPVWPVRVLVVPDGSKTGEYYAVYSQGTLDALNGGATPAWLELEPFPELEDE